MNQSLHNLVLMSRLWYSFDALQEDIQAAICYKYRDDLRRCLHGWCSVDTLTFWRKRTETGAEGHGHGRCKCTESSFCAIAAYRYLQPTSDSFSDASARCARSVTKSTAAIG